MVASLRHLVGHAGRGRRPAHREEYVAPSIYSSHEENRGWFLSLCQTKIDRIFLYLLKNIDGDLIVGRLGGRLIVKF